MVHQLYIKFSKIQLSKIVQLGGQFGPPIQPNKEIASFREFYNEFIYTKIKEYR